MTSSSNPEATFIAFILELPFRILTPLDTWVVVPARPAERPPPHHPVRLRVAEVRGHKPQLSDAVLRRLLDLGLTSSPTASAEDEHSALNEVMAKAREEEGAVPRCVVELETVAPPKPWGPTGTRPTFEYCLEALNRFLRAYIVATEDTLVHPISVEHLGPLVVADHRQDRGVLGRISFPNTSASVPGRGEPQEDPHRLAMLNRCMVHELHDHPIDNVRVWFARAGRAADVDGDYETAVSALQTSAEVLVYAILGLIGVDEGKRREQIVSARPSGLDKAIAKLGQLLGGTWNPQVPGPVADYRKAIYEQRNRIVHAGHRVSRDEAHRAFDVYQSFWDHVLSRVIARRSAYPRTALTLHGSLGLAENGALDARMRKLIHDINVAGEEDRFWLPVDQRAAAGATMGLASPPRSDNP